MGNIDIEACYKKYAPMIFRRCLGILRNEEEALDAAQDVFIKLINQQNRLHDGFLSSLLYIMATNTCLNLLRQRKKQGIINQDPEIMFPVQIDPEFDKIEANMLMDLIISGESEANRAIFYMYYSDGMTLKEIGEVINLSVSGVRKRLTAFKARAIEKYEGEKL